VPVFKHLSDSALFLVAWLDLKSLQQSPSNHRDAHISDKLVWLQIDPLIPCPSRSPANQLNPKPSFIG
jgi:hypothetical protein